MKPRNLSFALLITVAFTACAGTDVERRVDEKLATQPATNRRELDARAAKLLAEAPGLTEAQRGRLKELQADLRTRLRALNAESLKLRALLLEDTLAPTDRSAEIAGLRKRLRSLAQARVDTLFQGIQDANVLLGRSRLIEEAMDIQLLQDESLLP